MSIHRHVVHWTTILCMVTAHGTSMAQSQAGRAGFGFNAGTAKYLGEFTDNSWWLGGDLFVRYNVLDWFSLQAQFGYANPRFRVDADNAIAKYTDYFGVNNDGTAKTIGDRFPNGTLIVDDSEDRRNNTRIFSYELIASINLLPNQPFVPYVFGGVGVMSYQVRPGLSGGAGLGLVEPPNNGGPVVGTGILPGQAAGLYETGGMNGGLIFPVGLGFELYVSDNVVFNGRGTFRFTSTKYLDDYNPGSMKVWDASAQAYSDLNAPLPPNIDAGTNDQLFTAGFGLTYYVFGRSDFDGDGVTNSRERQLQIDEQNPDSDGDGLPDGYEVSGSRNVPTGFTEKQIEMLPMMKVRTDPTKQDTDGDGLGDREELVVYETDPRATDSDADGLADNVELARKTDPNEPDTDGDGVLDGDEVDRHKTDPLMVDTDGDGLSDGEELSRLNTNPTIADTDNDGISDGDEVREFKTNPRAADTDNDGLQDGAELRTHKSDPGKSDTDGDALPDGDEVLTYMSDPTTTDSDDDGLSDGDEVRKYRSNPTAKDTDGDGLSDGDEVMTYNSDPSMSDTDGDRLIDGDEIKLYRTDPRAIDTDDDALSDGQEVLDIKTDPARPDTDGDMLKDGEELSRTRTNPLKADTDDDGIRDNVDKCPIIAGIAPDGCPPAPKANTVVNFPGVLFIVNTDKFDMTVPGTMESLNKIHALVEQCPDLRVEIEGHASTEGKIERNQELSELRASAVKNWLVNQGVSATKVTRTVGYGSAKPVIPEPKKGTRDQIEAARKQNRRIAVRVVETCR